MDAGKKPHLFIIDDDEVVLRILRRQAEALGFTVTTASSGNQASDVLDDDHGFDAVITDTQMDDGDGLTVLQYINRLDPEQQPPTLIHSSDHEFWPGNDRIDLRVHVPEHFGSFARFGKKSIDYPVAVKFMKEILAARQ